MQIDMPKLSLGLGVLVTIETGVGGGLLSLTNAIPAAYIPGVQAWCNLLAFAGTAILTAMHAFAGPTTGVLASPPTVAQANQVMAAAKAAGAVILFLILAWPGGAAAQDRTPTPRTPPAKIGGPIGQALDKIQGGGDTQPAAGTVTVGNQKFELTDAVIAKVLPDLTYATALAHQNKNVITAPCFDAVLGLVNGWSTPVNGADGQPLQMPDPHVLVTLERASELLHQLQPDSTVSVGCGALGQALQKDIATLVGTVLSGGALGLFKLPIVPLP